MKKWLLNLFVVAFIVTCSDIHTTSASSIFNDVPTSHQSYEAIFWAKEQGISNGYSNGEFKPNDTVTEGQFITMLMSYLQVPTTSQTITKNNAKAHPHDVYYNTAATYQIPLNGYFNDIYRGQPIKRGLVAQTIASFMDVNGTMASQIDYLVNNKISSGQNNYFQGKEGYEDLYFGALNTVTRAQAVQFLYNMQKQGLTAIKVAPQTGNINTLAKEAYKHVNLDMMSLPDALTKTGTTAKVNTTSLSSTVFPDGKVAFSYDSKDSIRVGSLIIYDATGKALFKALDFLPDEILTDVKFLPSGNVQVTTRNTLFTLNANGKVLSKKSIPDSLKIEPLSHSAERKPSGEDTLLEVYNYATKSKIFTAKFEGDRHFIMEAIGENHLVVSCNRVGDYENYCYAIFDKKGNKLYEVNRPEGASFYVARNRIPVYISPLGKLYFKETQHLEGKDGRDFKEVFFAVDHNGHVIAKTELPKNARLLFDIQENQQYIATFYDHNLDAKRMMTISHDIYKFK